MRQRRTLRAQNRQIALPDRRCRYATRRALSAQVIVLNNRNVVVCWACEYSGLREGFGPGNRTSADEWLDRLRYASIRVLFHFFPERSRDSANIGRSRFWCPAKRLPRRATGPPFGVRIAEGKGHQDTRWRTKPSPPDPTDSNGQNDIGVRRATASSARFSRAACHTPTFGVPEFA